MGILSTVVTMNHVHVDVDSSASTSTTTKQIGGGIQQQQQQQHCNVFFMGKTVEQVKEQKPLLKSIEEKLLQRQHNNNMTLTMTLCTDMKLPRRGIRTLHVTNLLGNKDTKYITNVTTLEKTHQVYAARC